MRTRELTKGLALLSVSFFWTYQMMHYVHTLVS